MHERRRYVGGWSVVLERFVASDAWVVIQALWPNLNFKANNARRSRVPKRRWSPTGNCSRSVGVGAQRPLVNQTRRHVEFAVNLSLTCTSTIMIATSGTRLPKSVKRVIEAVNPCDQCGGECHQGMDMSYQTWPLSQQFMYDLLLCDAVPHSRLNVPALP
jgi:hypothetical protein